jgi:hypothetical protein
MPGEANILPEDIRTRWYTYSEIWAAERFTRGALDNLVNQGKVRWANGGTLKRALGHLPDAPEFLESQVYYDVGNTWASEATSRLLGEQVDLVFPADDMTTKGGPQGVPSVLKVQGADRYSHIKICPHCGRDVTRVYTGKHHNQPAFFCDICALEGA